jgi:hypothetical protein
MEIKLRKFNEPIDHYSFTENGLSVDTEETQEKVGALIESAFKKITDALDADVNDIIFECLKNLVSEGSVHLSEKGELKLNFADNIATTDLGQVVKCEIEFADDNDVARLKEWAQIFRGYADLIDESFKEE